MHFLCNAIPHLHEEICWGHYYSLLFSRVVLLNWFTKSSKFGEGFINDNEQF